ncbi:MAG: hypothetical protein ACLGHS_11800, partial [Actinomycetes bacterium]
MSSPLQVVAIIGSPTDPDQLFRSALGGDSLQEELAKASGRDVRLQLVSWSPSERFPQGVVVGTTAGTQAVDRVLTRIGAVRLQGVLQKYPAGRLLNSLGPLDQSR